MKNGIRLSILVGKKKKKKRKNLRRGEGGGDSEELRGKENRAYFRDRMELVSREGIRKKNRERKKKRNRKEK